MAQTDPNLYYSFDEKTKDFGESVRKINWKKGDDAHNIKELIYTVYHGAITNLPELKNVIFDPTTQGFTTIGGEQFTDKDFARVVSDYYARTDSGSGPRIIDRSPQNATVNTAKKSNPYRAGIRTAKRAAFFNTFLRKQSSEVRAELLGTYVRELQNRGLADSLKGTFYSRNIPDTITVNGNFNPNNDSILFSRAHSTQDIPDAIILNPLGSAKNNADYELAKAGDVEAATRLAKVLVTPKIIKDLKERIKNADVVVGVTSVEQSGNNALPEAAAVLIAKELGVKYDENILQDTSPKRTGMNGLDRIFNRPLFDGEVIQDAGYIFVDDTITQGGTFASLSAHVVSGGGKVVANIALTGKEYSSKIAISDEQLNKVREKFGDLENEFKQATGYDFTGLTASESRYVTLGISPDKFRDRIIAESQKATRNSNQQTA